MKDIKDIDFQTAKTVYQTAVQTYKDTYKDNFWKNHSWPWSKTGIERSGELLAEIADGKTDSVAKLLSVIADEKYNTGEELIGIIKQYTLQIFGVTQDDINTKAKTFEQPAYFTFGGRPGHGTAHEAITFNGHYAQSKAKDEIFTSIVAQYKNPELSWFSCLAP